MREEFETLPKTRHWRSDAQFRHFEATPEQVMETLRHPDIGPEIQSKGRTAYYRYIPEDGFWFRVVLDADGSLRTAFRDDDTMRIRGRP